jgi:molybdate transport system substrate-binding protein
MKNCARMFASALIAFVILSLAGIANAAEIKVLCAAGFRTVMDDLVPKFERASGHKLVVSFDTAGLALKRLQGGEAADLVILPREGIDTLVKEGKAATDNVTPLARVGLNLAVRKGASKPDISSPDALKRTLLAAKSISYLDPASGGASSSQFAKVLDQLGIAKEMKAKTVLVGNTKEMEPLVANGKAEIVVQIRGNLLTLSGIDIVGPLPGSLYQPFAFTAVVMGSAKEAGTARALVNYLRTPESAKVIKSKGMDPA